jgi:HSP20 family protein
MDSKNLLRLTDEIENPILELRQALSDVLRAARRAVGGALEKSPARGVARSLLQPRVKIADAGDEIIVTAELPGTGSESITVTLSPENVLRIRVLGDRQRSGKASTTTEPSRRRGDRPVDRSITLQHELSRDGATAVLENGKLTVRLPKRKEEDATVPEIGTRAA